MNRRTFLRGATGAAWAGVAVGLSGDVSRRGDEGFEPLRRPAVRTPVTEHDPDPNRLDDLADGFDEVVDVGQLLEARGGDGGDDTGTGGGAPVHELLSAALDDDTLAYLPAGEYRIEGSVVPAGYENVGLYGPEATIVPGDDVPVAFHVDGRDVEHSSLHVEGLYVDLGRTSSGARALNAMVADDLVVRDCTVAGQVHWGRGGVRVDVTDPGGTGEVTRLRLPDGAAPGTQVTGCYVGSANVGDVTFVDCTVAGFPDNGLYADPPAGTVTVDGGYFANNDIANVRVRGGSTVRNAHVRCDADHAAVRNMRGIRLTDHRPAGEAPPAVVEDCLVELLDAAVSDAAIDLSSDLEAAVVRDTHVRVDADGVPALRAATPDEAVSADGGRPRLECERVAVHGAASGKSAIHVADRDGCRFDNVCVVQSGSDRDGFELRRSADTEVSNCRVAVTGESVVCVNADVDVSHLSTGRPAHYAGGCGW